MNENPLKSRLRADLPVFGLLTPVHDPTVVEAAGLLGFDCYMLDCEHGEGGPMQVAHFVRACESVGMTPLARVRSADPKLVLQFMDSGLVGLMLPGVTTADDVKRFVEAVKYPPLGRRGIGPVRANGYLLGPTAQDEYIRVSNESTLVLPQIETMEAVKNLDSLLQVEGVDGFFVGPRDLSMAMGFYDGPAHAEVQSLIDDLFGQVRGAGLPVGITAGTGAAAADAVARGARIILGSIANLLKVGAGEFLAARGR